jgi:hypothetical protein
VNQPLVDKVDFPAMDLMPIKVPKVSSRRPSAMWNTISGASIDQDLELAVIDGEGLHALVFPCRRVDDGWINAQTGSLVAGHPTHWRNWQIGEMGETGSTFKVESYLLLNTARESRGPRPPALLTLAARA